MRVLLVEDDPMIGDAIQGALKDASYAADWVKDGQTALTTLGCQHYDLVLLDLGLPGKDGLEVLASIRAKDNPVPLLIITARDGLDDRLRGLDGGPTTTCPSPFRWRNCWPGCAPFCGAKVARQRQCSATAWCRSIRPPKRLVPMMAPGATVQPRVLAAASLAGSAWCHPSRSELEDRIYGWGKRSKAMPSNI
jgi:two-component system OmpR family response regulator